MKKIKVTVGETEYVVGLEELEGDKVKIVFEDQEHIVRVSEQPEGSAELMEYKTIKAPMPGTISQVKVRQGDNVNKGSVLLTFLAMKMENSIVAPVSGKIKEIKVKANDAIETDQVLVLLE